METQRREKVGAAGLGSQLAWRASQPCSLLVSPCHLLHCPPAPRPGPERQGWLLEGVCLHWSWKKKKKNGLSFALCYLFLNLYGIAVFAAHSQLDCRRNLKEKVLLWDKRPEGFTFTMALVLAFMGFIYFIFYRIYWFFISILLSHVLRVKFDILLTD